MTTQEAPLPNVRALRSDDLEDVAEIHVAAFPGYFLTSLGSTFLKLYYAEFCDRPGNYGVVGVGEGRVIGFVAGTASSKVMYDHFYRRQTWRLLPIVLRRLVIDPTVRRRILARVPHLLTAATAVFGRLLRRRGVSLASRPGPSKVIPRLLSIGLHPDYHGGGTAIAMVDHFCQLMHDDGIQHVGLSVFADNERAIKFYLKNGWIREDIQAPGLYFTRATKRRDSRLNSP